MGAASVHVSPPFPKDPIAHVLQHPCPSYISEAERITWGCTTYDGADRQFRAKYLRDVEPEFGIPIARQYKRLYDAEGARDANQFLLSVIEHSEPVPGVRLSAGPETMRRQADLFAKHCRSLQRSGLENMVDYAIHQGIKPPSRRHSALGRMGRLCDGKWWFKQIRRETHRTREHLAQRLNLVGRHGEPYVSDYSLRAYKAMQAQNELLLSLMEAVNTDTGQIFDLQQLRDASLANPRNRYSEMIVRVRGFETTAQARDHAAYFLTATCPSRFHPLTAGGKPNPRFNDQTAREAQKYLCRVFARFRAWCKRHGIPFYGIRVVEPHKSGTPHWHLLLFMPPDLAPQLIDRFHHYALEDSPDEPGAQEHRVRVEFIDPAKGDATSYIAKYLAKNIDSSIGTETDSRPVGTLESDRIRAWASLHGVHQFEFFGGPPVAVWRELRRLQADAVCEGLRTAAECADRADWAGFVEALGGPLLARSDISVKLLYEDSRRTSRYGDPSGPRLVGLTLGAKQIVTRPDRWEIRRRVEPARNPD